MKLEDICLFTKEYDEPTEKYNIFSFSVFYMKKYLRFYSSKAHDISVTRQKQFLYNLTLNIQNLERGFFGNNWYIRIFYDQSLFKFKIGKRVPWLEFIKFHKKNKRVQFVKFECNLFKNKTNKNFHLNLFGTLPRLYPIFEKNDLLDTIVIFDADNFITKDFFYEIYLFKKSHYDYNSFCSKYNVSYYKNENSINKDKCYLSCGMVSFKKKLPMKLWNFILYQIKYFEDKIFYNLISKLNKEYYKIMKNQDYIKWKDLGYGIDEIVLNHYIKKFMDKNNYKLRVVRFKPNIVAIISMIITYMKYNIKNNNEILVKKILKNILKKDYKNNMEKDLNEFYNLFSQNTTYNSSYEELLPYIEILRTNYDLIEELGVLKSVLLYIKNIEKNNYESSKTFDKYMFSYSLPFYF